MRCSFFAFESIARQHMAEISDRGYREARQLRYSGGLLRNFIRSLLGKTWKGYRTYWKARTNSDRKVFIKVYFGNAERGVAILDAENEYRLAGYLKSACGEIDGLRWVEPIDFWTSDQCGFVAYDWIDMRQISS
jgi:hypothetical protein